MAHDWEFPMPAGFLEGIIPTGGAKAAQIPGVREGKPASRAVKSH